MSLTVPLADGLVLRIGHPEDDARAYPTTKLQKGLLLSVDGRDVAEEGIGFGVPVLARGYGTVFPGGLEIECRRDDPLWEVTARYRLDLVERLARPNGGRVQSRTLYAAKDALAGLHRRAPRLRGALTAISSWLRAAFGWETTYVAADFSADLTVTSTIHTDTGTIDVTVDLPDLAARGVTEVVVMNEQGARHFAQEREADGSVRRGGRVGTWDEVAAASAGFVCPSPTASFWLDQAPGARLYRGRELVGTRLSWAGFGYAFPPTLRRFTYSVRIARTS